VLYRENHFVFKAVSLEARADHTAFARANLLRLRLLTLQHPCTSAKLNVDHEHKYGSRVGDDFNVTPGWDSDDDVAGGRERIIMPLYPERPTINWHPVLQNLTRLTLTLTVQCCDRRADFEACISDDKELNRYASRQIKKALNLYDWAVPASVEMRRQVWCEDHACSCRLRKKTCARIQEHLMKLWVGKC
jgi:hypothetical protein